MRSNESRYTPHSGDPRYSVERYALDLKYTPRTNRLTGLATLSVTVGEPTRTLRVDLVGLRAGKVRVNGLPHRAVKQTEFALQLKFDDGLAVGDSLELQIEYAGRPALRRTHWGPIGWEELENGSLVAAQPIGAPTWFPCNDRIDDRARTAIRFTTDSEFFVAATGVPGPVTKRGGSRTWNFASDVPTATYLVSVHVGEYAEFPLDIPLSAGGRIGRMVTPRAQSKAMLRAFSPLSQMVQTFEQRFGPYPQEDLTVVVVGEELEIPLESQGLITFGSNHAAPAEQRLIAHELAHQWFGNSVGLSTLQDIWLNEGFCCYAEWIWSEESGGKSAAQRADEHYAKLEKLPQDLLLADPGPVDLFDDRVYKRGALLLEALRRTIGDAPFRTLLLAWAETNRHRLVRSEDFCELAQTFSESSLQPLWRDWLYSEKLPKLPKPPPQPKRE